MMGALPQSSACPFNRKLGFVYAKYFANHRHNAASPRSYFLDQLCQADRRENPKPVAIIDILAAIDLLVEPSFQGHEGTMDHRAVGKRPVVVPPKHVRIAEPRPRAIACDDGQTIVAGISPGGEID